MCWGCWASPARPKPHLLALRDCAFSDFFPYVVPSFNALFDPTLSIPHGIHNMFGIYNIFGFCGFQVNFLDCFYALLQEAISQYCLLQYVIVQYLSRGKPNHRCAGFEEETNLFTTSHTEVLPKKFDTSSSTQDEKERDPKEIDSQIKRS